MIPYSFAHGLWIQRNLNCRHFLGLNIFASPSHTSFFRPNAYPKSYNFYSPQSLSMRRSKMASTEHAEHATLALAQKICLHFRLISSVLQTEVSFHKDAFLQVKILTEDEKLLHERSIGDGDTKIGKGVLLVELSCYWQTVVLCQWTVWCFLVRGVLKDCFQPLI